MVYSIWVIWVKIHKRAVDKGIHLCRKTQGTVESTRGVGSHWHAKTWKLVKRAISGAGISWHSQWPCRERSPHLSTISLVPLTERSWRSEDKGAHWHRSAFQIQILCERGEQVWAAHWRCRPYLVISQSWKFQGVCAQCWGMRVFRFCHVAFWTTKYSFANWFWCLCSCSFPIKFLQSYLGIVPKCRWGCATSLHKISQ